MAEYLTKIAHDSEFIHPAQLEKGWWERDDRFVYREPTVAPFIIGEDDVEDCIGR